MAKSPYKQVNKRIRQWVLEDGSFDSRPVSLWLDPRDSAAFVFKLPDYVARALGCADEVRAATADLAERGLKEKMDAYQKWYRTAKAEPVIILKVQYLGVDDSGDQIDEESFFFRSSVEEWLTERCIGVRYRLAFRVNSKIHYRDRKWTGEAEEFRVGSVMHSVDGEVLDYSEELHAKIDSICAAVNRAAQQLHEILHAKDIRAKLMSTPLLERKGP